MNQQPQSGEEIELTGNSGQRYVGQIYTREDSTSELSGKAIVCLTNSDNTDRGWTHRVNSIYDTENITGEIAHLRSRDDISHMILLPYNRNDNGVSDKVDDLIRHHLHK
jgi:hypothetical protein